MPFGVSLCAVASCFGMFYYSNMLEGCNNGVRFDALCGLSYIMHQSVNFGDRHSQVQCIQVKQSDSSSIAMSTGVFMYTVHVYYN